MRHVLINSHLRSGGSLLARLFDDHPSCMSFPLEMRYAKKKVFWPDLEDILINKNVKDLIKEIDIEWTFNKSFRFIDGNKTLAKDLYGKKILNFSYDRFLESLMAELSDADVWSHEYIINSIGNCFFKNWDNGIHFKAKCLYLINHMSMMCFAGAEYFFRHFPYGRIIHSIRSPWDWYASMQKHLRVPDGDTAFFQLSMNLWRESTIRGIQNANTFENYLLIRYEDMVLNWDKIKIELQEFLDIEDMQDTPTLGGEIWHGNSSYGPKSSLNSKSVHIADKILSKEKIDYILKNYGELAIICGYESDSLLPVKDKCRYTDDLLQFEVYLSKEAEIERLRCETKRMSALLFNVHRYFARHFKENSAQFLKRK